MTFAAGVYLSEFQNTISRPLHTVYVHTVYLFTQGRGERGRVEPEKVRGATLHKARSKIPTLLTVSPVYKL